MKSTIKQAKPFLLKGSVSAKILAILLSFVLITGTFSACDRTVVSTQADPTPDKVVNSNSTSDTLRIGYSAEDSLNPFFAKTDLNSDLTSLVFEPLFYLDDTFRATPSIASTYNLDSNVLTVKLDTSAAFSDGVQLSCTDVIYSFNMAKNSSVYRNELSNITNAAAVSADTVRFFLSGNYINAQDSLTFPIVKSGTAANSESVPIGTGCYTYKVTDTISLVYNPYCRKPQPNIRTIELYQLESSSTLIHTLELGTIDAFFDDLSSGSYSQANASVSKTNLTNLVFLGMNSNSYGLVSSAVRQAVYYSVNRQSIVTNAFKKYAVESYTPYHPQWHVLSQSDYDTSQLALDYSKAQSLMKNAGFTETLNYRLIVYSGNNFKVAAAEEIAENLANIGLNITISELSWEGYKESLMNGNYDFYIGEIKLPGNMDISALLSPSGTVYGIAPSDTTSAAYAEFTAGNISLNSLTSSFLQNMPFVPICFRMGALIYSRDITPAADCDMGNVYKNIYEWNKIKNNDSAS